MLSANVNGINDNRKKEAIKEHICKNSKIIFLQETKIDKHVGIDDLKRIFFGYYMIISPSTGNNGNCGGLVTMIKKIDCIKINYASRIITDRYICIDITVAGSRFRLINIYAPNDGYERIRFFHEFEHLLDTNKYIIMGGDFNCIDSINLDRMGGSNKEANVKNTLRGSEVLKRYKLSHDIIDVFRTRNPDIKAVTFTNGKMGSRLDKFYISASRCENVTKMNIEPNPFSDHDAISMTIKFNQIELSREKIWKCNVEVLREPKLKGIINELVGKIDRENDNWWDKFKEEVKSGIVEFCSLQQREKYREITQIKKSIFSELRNSQSMEKIQELKLELRNKMEKMTESSRSRSKAKHLFLNENINGYFLRVEKENGENRIIREIENVGGKTEAILKHFETLYREKFKKRQNDEEKVNEILENSPKINDCEQKQLTKNITEAEIKSVIKAMSKNKSPGMDGLPIEFYQINMESILPALKLMIREVLEKGMTESQKMGIITFIPKENDAMLKMKCSNWRPITLLNSDYKVISKIIAERMSQNISNLVNNNQSCAKGRNISENLHKVRNIIEISLHENQSLSCVNIDIEQAFDSISHDYMFGVLATMGFATEFTEWVRILYRGIKSRLYINSRLSEEILIDQSVRQGCSSSMILFVLCMEPLLRHIDRDNDIKGFKVKNLQEIKYVAHADDVTFMIKDAESLIKLNKWLNSFEAASNLKLNVKKTKILNIGKNLISTEGFDTVPEMKILGLWTNKKGFSMRNSDSLKLDIVQEIKRWESRDLSMYGKAIVANVMIASKIWYIAQNMRIDVVTLASISEKILNFVWGNKLQLIHKSKLRAGKDHGGLGLIDVYRKVEAMGINHYLKAKANEDNIAHYWFDKQNYANNGYYNKIKEYYSRFKEMKGVDFVKRKVYKVKEIYDELTLNDTPQIRNANLIKSRLIDGRKKILNWKILHGGVPTGKTLVDQGIRGANKFCDVCKKVETADHIFKDCYFTKRIWDSVVLNFDVKSDAIKAHLDQDFVRTLASDEIIKLSYFRHAIWIARCQRVFDKIHQNEKQIISKIREQLHSYNRYMRIFRDVDDPD